ncbi:DUF5780 domain-containing protein [Paenibacillus woosongensis]|uniref:DUF5780 domain-containing protein n=1 Tax=Paenibacillus woosongensis TaxID=307580 RepID=A0AA95L289_9BACL|nr:DUF5780 domain-containing protein [Paenibacillus woosongensis]WHX51069.1 DUF5780 domain-containing protein [Paenibacillus woosongensis]
MTKCNNCGHELSDESLFCNKCGSKIGVSNNNRKMFSLKNRKWLYLSSSLAVVILVAGVLYLVNSNPIHTFKKSIQESSYKDAIDIYNKEIKGNTKRETEVETYLESDLIKIQQDFENEKINFDNAISKINTIEKTKLLTSKVSEVQNKIISLNDSRIAFKAGNELIKSNNIKDALVELKKVSEDDSKNYEIANDLIEKSSSEYKNIILKNAEKAASNNKFEEALNEINQGLSVMQNDSDLIAKKSVYEKKKEEQIENERKIKMQEAKNKQEVIVEKASITIQSTEYKALYPDMIQVIVRNKSNKTVKNMVVVSLGFDSNGLPVKIRNQYSSEGDYAYEGYAENVNIVTNATFGKGKGWSIHENLGIKTVLSCVKEVEYYDGTTWENEYYNYWLDEFKEKPLH